MALIALIYTVMSGLVSVQPWSETSTPDLRYYAAVIPLVACTNGLFVSWVWMRSRVAAIGVLAVILGTSAGPYGVTLGKAWMAETPPGLRLAQFIKEVPNPYFDARKSAAQFLRRNAAPSELVHSKFSADREALVWYAGDHVRVCCSMDRKSAEARPEMTQLPGYLFMEDEGPDWVIDFGTDWDGPGIAINERYEHSEDIQLDGIPMAAT